MYLDNDGIEKGVLRQGDIVAEVHLLGAINSNSIQYTSTATAEENQYVGWSIPSPPNYGDAMVL